ncbi:MAG: hypothetical protein D6803_03470, partial [Anaerolineae bacterium]
EWEIITVTATSPEVQIEYYDPGLDLSSPNRRYAFNWMSDYDVDAMLVQVQQPVGATDLRVQPALGTFTTGGDGLQYYVMDIGAPRAGDQVSVEIQYTKDNDTLSVESFPVQAGSSLDSGSAESTAPSAGPASALPWILGGLGVLLIAGGVFWYWRSGQGETHRKPRRRKRASSGESPAGAVYCPQCGKRAEPGDRFCRACGSRLRNT